MKIKLDENLPDRLALLLTQLGHDVQTIPAEGLAGKPDRDIWDAVQKESRFLVTQDLDFSDLRQFAPGSHHGLLLIRLHSPNRKNLIARVVELFKQEGVVDWSGCFVVATERKIRVVRPQSRPGTPE
jgi:predicted nuclease of predicted toxin-antitoxin system